MKKNGQGDVKQMNTESLADKGRKKRAGTISIEGQKEAKGYRRRLKNYTGHGPFVACICCRLTS